MSSILDLPNYSGIEEGWDEASDLFDVQSFVNDSLNTIQTFFVRMVQLDPEENLMGETGRETNGFRLTTEDEPDGVAHDCFLSLRSDHIAAIGLQSGKQSPSISEVFFGGWDSTTNLWGTEGAIRLEATTAGARPKFSFLCNYGSLSFNNIVPDATLSTTFSAQPALTLESVAALVLKDRVVNKLPAEGEDAAGFYSQSGIPYAFDGSGNTYNLTSTGTGLTPSGNYTITGDWTINGDWTFGSSTGYPDLPATTKFTEANTGFSGTSPFVVVSKGLVSNLNAEFVDGRAGSTIPDTTSATDITGVWSFSKIEAGIGETIGIGTDASNPKDIQLFFAYLNTGNSSATQTIETIATTLDTVFMLESTITAINACSGGSCNSGDGACYIIRQLFKNDGGTVTNIGDLDPVFTRAEAGPAPGGNMEDCEVSLSISGTSVLVQVTGIAGGGTAATEADIKWNAVTKIYNAIP
jgi:hypothetical protein